MDERREDELPLRDTDRGQPADQRGPGLTTADLAGTADRPAPGTGTRSESPGAAQPTGAAATTVAQPREAEADPGAGPGRAAQAPQETEPGSTPLFSLEEADGFRSRWQDIQSSFVDEPRRAVEQADGLVAEVMKQLAQGFAEERSKLEAQWDRGDATETEGLRLAFRRYRSFFDRLLSV
jgi:hypothetical protein